MPTTVPLLDLSAQFAPLREETLNADEQLELVAARANGVTNFTVADTHLTPFAGLDPASAAAADNLSSRCGKSLPPRRLLTHHATFG